MTRQRDVIIIGAGVAGSSLATRLAKLGWDVILLEREQFPRQKVCGGFLSPEALVSLKNLGLYQTVLSLSPAVIERARLVSPKGITVGVDLPGQGWGISRFALDAALADAAQEAGVELQTGHTVTAIKPHKYGFGVAFQSRGASAELQGRAVIAACGRHTTPGLPPPTESKPQHPFVGLKCHYQAIDMPPQVELFFFPGGYAGVAPVEDDLTNVCLLTTPDAFTKGGKNILTMIKQVSHWNPALGQRLSGGNPLPETATAVVAPVDTGRMASPWTEVACVGDTAVMFPPLSGEGLASALRSTELCAAFVNDYLQGKLSLEAWEAAYSSAWYTTFNRSLRLTRFLQVSLNTPLVSEVILGAGWLLPPLANLLIQATRSKRQSIPPVSLH